MTTRTREEDEILAYACYKIIKKYTTSENEKLDGLRFNKMISLLDNELLTKKNIDIKLPSCWYYYGHEVVPRELPESVRFEFEDEEKRRKGLFWYEGTRPSPSSRIRSEINYCVDSLYNRFPPDGDVYEALDAVYEYSPFDFQKLYKQFRTETLETSQVDPDGVIRSKLFYINEIKKAFSRYPWDTFQQLKVPATQVEILASAIFDKAPEKNNHAIRLTRNFWEMFCKFLRIHENGHKYVGDERMNYWMTHAEEEFVKYQHALEEDIYGILKDLPAGAIDDPMIMMFLSPLEFEPHGEIDDTLYG